MPTYDFINQETGEHEQHIFRISEYDDFIANNPHLKRLITGAPSMVRNSTGGIKNDAGWNENLSRIAEAHPNSALADKVGGRSTKTVKTQEAGKKYGIGEKGKYKINWDANKT